MAFPLATFRLRYPQFQSVSDEAVLDASVQAECYVTQHGCDCSEQIWLLMTAHLLTAQLGAQSGESAPGPVASTTVGGVSVSFQAPPYGTSAYKFWLNTSPYGQQFLALMSKCSVGGVYIGGSPERAAFRQVGGRFPNGGRLWRG